MEKVLVWGRYALRNMTAFGSLNRTTVPPQPQVTAPPYSSMLSKLTQQPTLLHVHCGAGNYRREWMGISRRRDGANKGAVVNRKGPTQGCLHLQPRHLRHFGVGLGSGRTSQPSLQQRQLDDAVAEVYEEAMVFARFANVGLVPLEQFCLREA